MDLKGLIHRRLLEAPGLAEMLARYGEDPAIFYTEVPADQQPGWGGKEQYPRICFRNDMQVDQERSSVGLLNISLYTRKDPSVMERLETLVRGCLQDVLMKPSGQAPFCVSWAKTDPYLLEGMAVWGKDIFFDILEYPDQETTDPDPVMAVCIFIKDMYPDSVVLGIDRIEGYVDPVDTPVFYCRLENIQKTTGHCMNTIVWFTARIAVHLLYPDASSRLEMIAAIEQRMVAQDEIIMLDQSPMMVKDLSMDNRSDYLREGQLMITGKYGCLRCGEKGHMISSVGIGSTD